MAASDASWEAIQTKTFTNWCNSHLRSKKVSISDITTDFCDGVRLCQLLSAISEERIKIPSKKPKMRIQKLENLNKALQFVADHDVALVGISAEELEEGNLKLTLGMIWTIILRFAINLSEDGLTAKEGLMLWVRRQVADYKLKVNNFTTNFRDGKIFAALIHKHRSDLIDYEALKAAGDNENTVETAFACADEQLDIPRLMDVVDVTASRPDEKSIMAQVAEYHRYFSKFANLEVAGRRIGKFLTYNKSVNDMRNEYISSATAMVEGVAAKQAELAEAELPADYAAARSALGEFKEYKSTTKRSWLGDQIDLEALLKAIQTKLKAKQLAAWVPADEITGDAIDAALEQLGEAESEHSKQLGAKLRETIQELKQNFAALANSLMEAFGNARTQLKTESDAELEEQLAAVQALKESLDALQGDVDALSAADEACNDANIDDNEHTDFLLGDVEFQQGVVTKAVIKNITFIEAQIAARDSDDNITEEMLAEFRDTFNAFDKDGSNTLSQVEFKACLTALGQDTEDAAFNKTWKKLASEEANAEDPEAAPTQVILFEAFTGYMVELAQDTASPEQVKQSFKELAGGAKTITEVQLRSGGVDDEGIAYLVSVMEGDAEKGYNYVKYLKDTYNI